METVYYHLLAVWQGTLELCSYKYRCRVEAGQACLLPVGFQVEGDLRPVLGHVCALQATFVVICSGSGVDALAGLNLPAVVAMDDADLWHDHAAELVDGFDRWTTALRVRILSRPLLDGLLARLLLTGRDAGIFDRAPGRPVPEWVQAAHQMLLRECGNSRLTLEDIARRIGISHSRLMHGYRQYHGVSPGVQLRCLRLDRAERLLRSNPECGIADVAARCGFANAAAFAACFRRHRGVGPTAWRKAAMGAGWSSDRPAG